MITIVNYGMGNLGSIQNMFKRIGEEVIVTDDLELIARPKRSFCQGSLIR